MENNMFCFQCQETAKGFGCTLKGVCGKNATTARTMDLLLFVVRGISVVADQLRQHSLPVKKDVDNFIVDALFCTITNANFDDESIMKRIDKGLVIRNDLKHQAFAKDIPLPEADELNWKGSHDEYDAKAATVGVLREKNEDLRSLKELIMYGLKGMAAYLEHLTYEEIQKERDEILTATPADIRSLSDLIASILSDQCLCVVGNEHAIREESGMFTSIQGLCE